MSDTDEGDDGFDKDAEREKLREKYEQDQQQREATEHMSDLLLKGATMTNTHCDDCGSPVFRYEGEAFCPTCAGTRDVAQEGEGGQPQEAAGGQAGGQPQEAAGGQAGGQPQEAAGGQAGGQSQDATRTQQGGQPREAGSHPRTAGTQPAGERREVEGGDQPARGPERPASSDHPPGGEAADSMDLDAARERLDERATRRSGVGDGSAGRSNASGSGSPVQQGEVPSMAQTRSSLRRAIVSLSEQAAQSDDPTRAQHLLKGAREGSEALAALDGTTGE